MQFRRPRPIGLTLAALLTVLSVQGCAGKTQPVVTTIDKVAVNANLVVDSAKIAVGGIENLGTTIPEFRPQAIQVLAVLEHVGKGGQLLADALTAALGATDVAGQHASLAEARKHLLEIQVQMLEVLQPVTSEEHRKLIREKVLPVLNAILTVASVLNLGS